MYFLRLFTSYTLILFHYNLLNDKDLIYEKTSMILKILLNYLTRDILSNLAPKLTLSTAPITNIGS